MLDLVKLRSALDMKIKKAEENRKRLKREEKKEKEEEEGKKEKRYKEYIKICDRYDKPILEIMKRLKKDWYQNGKIIKQNGSWLERSLIEYSLVIPRYIPPIHINKSGCPEREYAKIFICRDWEKSRLYFKVKLLFFEKSLMINNYWEFNYLNPKYNQYEKYTTNLDIEGLEALIEENFEKVYGELIHKEGIKIS